MIFQNLFPPQSEAAESPGGVSWPLSEAPGRYRSKNAEFHQVATILGIWILVFCAGVHTMASMRTILVPLFWAFFLMMGLVPATDAVEVGILKLACCCGKKVQPPPKKSLDLGYDPMTAPNEIFLDEEEPDCFQTTVRIIAVIIVAASFLGLVSLFFVLIYVSALHMQHNWQHYQDGANKLNITYFHLFKKFSKVLPPSVLENLSKKALTGMEEVISSALSFILGNVSHSLVGGLMMVLYMVFWLFQPVHIGQNTKALFKQYIILKMLASAGYAFCVFLLLHFNSIDLAIVFGLITFLFNFVPEVGPFLAMALPVPVVLFDGRLSHPGFSLAVVLGGNMLLKCLWANIIEVKLVESNEDMKMHPVVILFFVAFFGWIWGATGMLLSVPAVAVIKASLHIMPDMYRDPMLIMLEGDANAPAKYNKWRSQTMDKITKSRLMSG